jgi:enoyl-CoA hydratase
MKQFQGEYMGSLMTGVLESMGNRVRPDDQDLMLTQEVYDGGLGNAVKASDDQFPPEFRLSKSGRKRQQPRPTGD